MVTTTSSTSETFNFAYALQGSPLTGFTLQDEDPSTKKLVDPAAGTVSVADPNGGHINCKRSRARNKKPPRVGAKEFKEAQNKEKEPPGPQNGSQ